MQLITGGVKEEASVTVDQGTEVHTVLVQQTKNWRPALEREEKALPKAEKPLPGMDRVTRNLIYNIPRTPSQKEVFGEDGSRYTIETISGEDYWDHSEHSGSLLEGEDGQGHSTEYIITAVKSGSLERKPLQNYRAFSATPGRVTESYTPADDVYRAELWVPTPDRDSKLELVRKGELYDLRAYKEEKKPTKLYAEIDEEAAYRTVPVEVTPESLKLLEYERKSLIEAQTMKIRPVNSWRSSEELYSDDGSPPASLHTIPDTSATDLSLSYDAPKSLDKSFSQENVDTEQINFLAARQQFLMLEKNKPDLLQGLKPQSRTPKQSDSNRYLSERDWQEENESPYVVTMTSQLKFYPDDSRQRENNYNAASVPSLSEENVRQGTSRVAMVDQDGRGKKEALGQQVPITSSREDWYPGQGDVDEGYGVGYGSDGSSSREVSAHWQYQDVDTEPTYMYETPIEREIRIAMEREEELRRERGIKGCTNTREMVAILKTPVLYRSPPSSPGRKEKDNRRGSYYVQREIERETKREEDLRSEGKLVGQYDKGPTEELGERKKRFEQQDVVPVLPNQTIYYKSPDFEPLEREASFSPVEIQEQDKPYDGTPEVTRRTREQVNRIPMEAYEPYLESKGDGIRTWNVPASYKNPSRNSWHPSSDFGLQTPRLSSEDNTSKTVVQDSRASPKDTFFIQKEYSFKPWRPGVSTVVAPQVPTEEPPPRPKFSEHVLYLENSFTPKPLRSQPSSLIEKEIEEVLQREEELQQQRRMLSLQSGSRDPTLPDCDDLQIRDQETWQQTSDAPDRHLVSLVSTPFRPLILKTITDESSTTFPREEQTYPVYSTATKGPASPAPEWEPRTPGKLKNYQLEEFERQQTHKRDQYDEPGRYELAGAVRIRRDLPKQHGVSLFSTPFRPLVVRTAYDESLDSAPMKEPASVTYRVAEQRPVSPTSEWELRTPGRLRESQLEEFERRRSRQRDDYGYAGIDPSEDVNNKEPRRYESAGSVRCHRDLPEQHGVSLFSTPFRPLVVRTAYDESLDSASMKDPASVIYRVAEQRPVSPTSEWELRTPGRLTESQLEEFERRRRRQRDDYGYAGIDPSDDVNNEIVESTRVSRRKSAMALRWEAGQYLNAQDE